MIKVSDKQWRAFAQSQEHEQFETEMVTHLRGFVPRFAETLREEGLRSCIRYGIERARVYGVTNSGLLRFYIELMFLFGGLFDTDPLYPWAGQILRDPRIVDEATRVDRLYVATLTYLDATGGSGREVALRILRRLKRTLSEGPMATRPSGSPQELFDALVFIHPERCSYLGELALRRHLARAHEVAVEQEVATHMGIEVVTILMFAIGHGFMEDPTFSWIGGRLRRASFADASQRALYLRRRTEVYVNQAIEHFQESADVP